MELISHLKDLARIPAGRRAFPAVVAGLFFLSGSAWAQISLVHVSTCGPQAFPALTCTIPSTASGNLLVVGWASNNGGGGTTIASITDNANGGSNGYSEAGNARAVDAGPNTMADLWYAKNIQSGATIVTITPNPTGTRGTAVIWEFSGVNTTVPLDQTAVLNSQPATTTPSSASITTTTAEVIVSVVNVQGSVTGILSGNSFTNDSTGNGNGWAHLITSSPGTYTAQWNNGSSGTSAATTAAFKVASSGGPLNPCDLAVPYGTIDQADVTAAVNMVLNPTTCTANIQAPGVCDIVTVQRVVNAAFTGVCVTGVGSTPHSVTLNWVASTSLSLTGYNIYRGITFGGPYTKLNSSPVNALSYVDTTVQAGQTYYYVATAVDSTSAESVFSNQAQGVVPSP